MKCKVTREQTKHACEHNKIIKHPSYYLSEHSYPSEQQLRAFEEYKLVLQIAADDGLSQYICAKNVYKLQLLSLEWNLEDLSNFRQLVRSSQLAAALQEIKGPLKRTKRNTPQAVTLVYLLTLKDSSHHHNYQKRLSSESNNFTNEVNIWG